MSECWGTWCCRISSKIDLFHRISSFSAENMTYQFNVFFCNTLSDVPHKRRCWVAFVFTSFSGSALDFGVCVVSIDEWGFHVKNFS